MANDKLLSAYNNLNEALANKRVNKDLVMQLADGLESDLGLTYKVKPFQFTSELTEVGLLQAFELSSYAKYNIEEMNYKNSKEVYDKTKNLVIGFIKMYKDRISSFDANTEVIEKLINFYENQAVADYVVGSDGSLLESKREEKATLRFRKYDIKVFLESLESTDDSSYLTKLLEDISNNEETYYPFLNLMMNIINKPVDSDGPGYGYVDNAFNVVGRPLYAVDIINTIVTNTYLIELENILDSTLMYFYDIWYGQDTINELSTADEISKHKEKALESLDSRAQILNCFNDEYGIKIFTFMIKIIYSKNKA